MTVIINGKQNTFERTLTVQELLEKTQVEMQEYITVQLNEEILKRENFSTVSVRDGDKVEFLYYMGGGR